MYAVPSAHYAYNAITAGPDGAPWYTKSDEFPAPNVADVSCNTTSGSITSYALPAGEGAPYGIAAGPGGALWLADGNQIGRITTGGIITAYPVPTNQSLPLSVAPAPDGAIWFTESAADKIGRVGVP